MPQRLALVIALLVAPSLAAAQTITITESHDQDRIINIAECSGAVSDQLSFTWTAVTASFTGTYDLWVSDTPGCPTNTGTTTTTTTAHSAAIATAVATSSLANYTTATNALNLAQIACPGPATALNFCLFPSGQNAGTSTGGIYGYTVTPAATGTLQLDLETPPPPVANPPAAGDSSLNVSWSQGTGAADAGTAGAAASYNIYCDVHPAVIPIAKKCLTVTGTGTTSGRITGLQNGIDYDVQVTAVSIGGNESDPSNVVTGSPVQINDFWRLYKADGGREQGGCATGAAGLVAVIALLPLALRRRRRRS